MKNMLGVELILIARALIFFLEAPFPILSKGKNGSQLKNRDQPQIITAKRITPNNNLKLLEKKRMNNRSVPK